jgi:YbbR domain-containing protein
MSLLRGLLLENLGLKFTALLLSLLVYLYARSERPIQLMVSFPVVLQELPDSLSLVGPVPPEVHAEIRGTGKQVFRLRFNRPPVTISLAGVRAGHFERSLSPSDLPLTAGLEVERMGDPRMLALEIDRRVRRRLPVATRLEWTPPAAQRPVGRIVLEPSTVTVIGPDRVVAKIDTVDLAPLRVDGKRDTVRAESGPVGLPEGCAADPATVRVTVVLGHAGS